MFRLTSFLKRRPQFSHSEFLDYWWREHSPIAAALPGLRHYSTTRPIEQENTLYDGVAELYFNSREAFDRVLGPDTDTEAINDVTNFIGSTDRYRLTETVHIDSPELDEYTLEDSVPVVEQTQFPVSELVVFDRFDNVSAEVFDGTLSLEIERVRSDQMVSWFATGVSTDDDSGFDVLLKRTYQEPGEKDHSSPARKYPNLCEVAEPIVEFVGYERTVVNELS